MNPATDRVQSTLSHVTNCQATCIGETGRYLSKALVEYKLVTRNGGLNNNIAEYHLQT